MNTHSSTHPPTYLCSEGKHRSGVSVSLNINVLGRACAGEEVVVESECKKVGDTLGFADVVLREGTTGREVGGRGKGMVAWCLNKRSGFLD